MPPLDGVPDTTWKWLEGEAQKRFGIRSWRPGQKEIIEAVMAGRDAFGILPTGGGKSLCFEIPALFLDKPIVVVSPLLALVHDQRADLEKAHIDATELDSSIGVRETRHAEDGIRHGALRVIYVTPERLRTDACIELLKVQGVSRLAIDEAHCLSQWGHDFRPAYLAVKEAAERLGRPPILALTATATADVAKDVVEQLGLRDPVTVRQPVARPNLYLSVHRTVNEEIKREVLKKILSEETGTVLVYTATVKAADEVADWLASEGASVARYHAQLGKNERHEAYNKLLADQVRVLVATKAFGLGVDKPNVRAVVHWQFPDSIESYWQEAGRAGRDGLPARCHLLFRLEDKRIQSYFLRGKYPTKAEAWAICDAVSASDRCTIDALVERSKTSHKKVEVVLARLQRAEVARIHEDCVERLKAFEANEVFAAFIEEYAERAKRDRARLAAMMGYAERTECRSEYVNEYFGEKAAYRCCNCDICVSNR